MVATVISIFPIFILFFQDRPNIVIVKPLNKGFSQVPDNIPWNVYSPKNFLVLKHVRH